ncbi:MAG: hypothetical protein HYX52_08795 [Chloroflexi bacterium]|nr:hypothetical protein [Chloroflexota bacterium]
MDGFADDSARELQLRLSVDGSWHWPDRSGGPTSAAFAQRLRQDLGDPVSLHLLTADLGPAGSELYRLVVPSNASPQQVGGSITGALRALPGGGAPAAHRSVRVWIATADGIPVGEGEVHLAA